MSKQQVLRFAVTDEVGRRAAVWRLWSDAGKSDIYLAVRSLGGMFKASLHESGNWHVAYTRGTFEELVVGTSSTQDDRFIAKWRRPPPFAKGVTRAIRIITPYTAVARGSRAEGNVIAVENAPKGKACQVTIAISEPGAEGTGESIVGSFGLANGEKVWLLRHVIEMPDFRAFGRASGRYYKGRGVRDLLSMQNPRMVVLGSDPDGTRVFYDVRGRLGAWMRLRGWLCRLWDDRWERHSVRKSL